MAAVLFLAAAGALGASSSKPVKPPSIEDYATIEAYVGDVPIYAFGYTYVYGASPELLPGVAMQRGNKNPVTKLNLKKSWEIEDSLCGSTPPREPKTMWNDDQPLLPIHLIDGDPETAWSSRGGTVPDREPIWIRIDLPAEAVVSSVSLVCCKVGPSTNAALRIGKSLPKELTVKLSRDARQWDTVYESRAFTGSDSGTTEVKFEPRAAKQIWIIANNVERVGWWGHSLSIGEVEVNDATGRNLALVSRGAGIQVSSTFMNYGMDRFTQDMLWPIQYDLGFKWTRVGYDMGQFLWSYVEREKGKLQIDPKADAAITDAVNNGIKVIMCLDKGNWLYHNPPRKTDWKKSRVKEMMDTYFDHPGWPTESPELMKGYLRYVDYMVRHFKGRVEYYEILNEWHIGGPTPDRYAAFLKQVIPVVKKADPDAKIMFGSIGFDRTSILACLGKPTGLAINGNRLCVPDKGVVVANTEKLRDATVSASGNGNAEAGIILRYRDPKNFLLGIYAPNQQSLYFHEVTDGNYGSGIAGVHVPTTIGPSIRVTASVEGADMKLSLTDGVNTYATSHTLTKPEFMEPGLAGLMHNNDPVQFFDDFVISTTQGARVFVDDFNEPDGEPKSWTVVSGSRPTVEKGLGSQIDAIGWHPFYNVDPDSPSYRSYRHDVEEFRNELKKYGFNGQLAATEWAWVSPYPGANPWCSEMGKAKYSAQAMTAHCGMGVISLVNETFQTARIDWDVSLLRNTFSVDPINPCQPQPIYYVLRNLSTVMDGWKAADYPVGLSGERNLDVCTFRKGSGGLMVAAWIPGKTTDGIVESESDMTLPGARAERASVIDIMDGTEQELNIHADADGTRIRGLLVKDYPTFIRIECTGTH